jgi:hypothetical protein
MNRFDASNLLVCAALAAAGTLSHAQGNLAQPPEPALPASEVAQARLLSGPLHKVADPVAVEGHLGRFVIESKFGKFSVHGANMLAVRVHELQAIEELQKVEKGSAFTDALTKSVSGVATFAGNVVTNPGGTVENIGRGIGTIFDRIGYMAKSGADYVGDAGSDLTAYGAKPKPGAAPSGEPAPPSFSSDPFGYNAARREWAKKLNVDPYTSNPLLRSLLDDASSATFAGNFAVSLALGAVVGPLQLTYAFDDEVRQSVWNKPPIDLERENQEKLIALGVPERAVRDLLRNTWFTPTLQTALVARLAVLGKIEGVETVVRTAAATQGETRARFLLESLAMLATHHEKEGRLAKVLMNGLAPVGVAADGRIVVAVATDYGVWSEDAADMAQRMESASESKTLLIAGNVSPQLLQDLEKAGWIVKSGLRT